MMNTFILPLFLTALFVFASSQDKKQVSLVRFIEAGDLEAVKALISPSEVESLFNGLSSSDEAQPTKKRKLDIEPLQANLNDNQALYSAVIKEKVDIIQFLLTCADVRKTADLAELIAVAVDNHFNDSALELLRHATPTQFAEAFQQAILVLDLDLVEDMIDYEGLDLELIIADCISNTVLHKDGYEMIRFFMTHPKIRAIECDKSMFLNWAVKHEDVSIYLLYLEMYGFDSSSAWVIVNAFSQFNILWSIMLMAHPNVDLTMMNTELMKHNCNFSTILDQMTWFLQKPFEDVMKTSLQFRMFRKDMRGALFAVACLRGDMPRAKLLIDLGGNFIPSEYAGMTLTTMIAMNRMDIFKTLAMQASIHGGAFEEVMDFCVIEFSARGNIEGIMVVFDALQHHNPVNWFYKMSIAEGETETCVDVMTNKSVVAQRTGLRGIAALLRLLSAHLIAMQTITDTNQFLPEDIQNFILLKSLENFESYYVGEDI